LKKESNLKKKLLNQLQTYEEDHGAMSRDQLEDLGEFLKPNPVSYDSKILKVVRENITVGPGIVVDIFKNPIRTLLVGVVYIIAHFIIKNKTIDITIDEKGNKYVTFPYKIAEEDINILDDIANYAKVYLDEQQRKSSDIMQEIQNRNFSDKNSFVIENNKQLKSELLAIPILKFIAHVEEYKQIIKEQLRTKT